jgi:3-deoxy-D-manno-octulosonic-acid transferase
MGPHYENFRGIVDRFREKDAIRIVPAEQLGAAIAELLSGSPAARLQGVKGKEVFEAEAGATDRTLEPLIALLRMRK